MLMNKLYEYEHDELCLLIGCGMKSIFYNSKKIRWRLPSRERLFHRLGEYDTMAEFTVLSERHFETLCKNAESYVDFVNTKAAEYNVKIRSGVTLDNYREALYKSFKSSSNSSSVLSRPNVLV